MKLSIRSKPTLVLPRYMNRFSSSRSLRQTPCRKMRGWGFGFCLNIFEKNSLQELRITLWASSRALSSQARVTSVKSWSSKRFWKAFPVVALNPFHSKTAPVSSMMDGMEYLYYRVWRRRHSKDCSIITVQHWTVMFITNALGKWNICFLSQTIAWCYHCYGWKILWLSVTIICYCYCCYGWKIALYHCDNQRQSMVSTNHVTPWPWSCWNVMQCSDNFLTWHLRVGSVNVTLYIMYKV